MLEGTTIDYMFTSYTSYHESYLRQILNTAHGLGLVEINGTWLIDEQLDLLWTQLGWRLELKRMNLNGLIKGYRHNQLLVAVRLQVSSGRFQCMLHIVIVRFIQALALLLRDECVQLHLCVDKEGI